MSNKTKPHKHTPRLHSLICILATALMTTCTLISGYAQPTRNGKLFDQGRMMTERSPRAARALDDAKRMLGAWTVEMTTFPTDTTSFTTNGVAEVTYMNRGFAYMTRMYLPRYDEAGHEASIIQFLTYNPATEAWVQGEASSYTGNITLLDGDFENGALLLRTAVRHRGGSMLTHYERTYRFEGTDRLTLTTRTSTNHGRTWRVAARHTFIRSSGPAEVLQPRADTGMPAPDRPDAASQFDFLIGSWASTHNIQLNGQWVKFPANATAVYALNGMAILEYNWYDVDQNLPDAATTIIRLYNHAMRRWESLYLDNRGNAPLFFGGQQEGQEMVLHFFEAGAADPIIPRYVFHDIENDAYAWYAAQSTNRGHTFNKTWSITFTRLE